MRWIDAAPMGDLAPPSVLIAARQAVAQRPDSIALRLTLARSCYRVRDFAGAAENFEAVLTQGEAGFANWHRLARSLSKIGRDADALIVCERGLTARGESAPLRLRQGKALAALGREAEARAAFERCVALGDVNYLGLTALLRPLARATDGAALLAACDALPAAMADNALVRASRAIALSRMGRVDEARVLVDLDRDVAQVAIDAPAGFADIAAFNTALAQECLTQRNLIAMPREMDITYCPDLANRPALAALLPLVRAAIDDYLARRAIRGDSALPPAPKVAKLFYGATVLAQSGVNGEHIHDHGRVSCVYHVQIPRSVAAASDDRGALTIGDCSVFSAGHQACWGRKTIKPRAGVLTLFPSHFFHDVIPSLSDEPRISIACDLIAVDA